MTGDAEVERVEGYPVTGPRTPVPSRWGLDIFVQRSSMRGRPWLRFFPRSGGGYDVTAWKTKRAALRGMYW